MKIKEFVSPTKLNLIMIEWISGEKCVMHR